MTSTSASPVRTSTGVKWYRRISVKLAIALGLAMFSIQFLASILIIESSRASVQKLEGGTRSPSRPYVRYLSRNLVLSPDGKWLPTPESLEVVETFLDAGESYLWLDANDRIAAAGKAMRPFVNVGDHWDLCESPQYCGVELGGDRRAGSTWSRLAIGGQPIGTFVLLWFEDPAAARLGQRQLQTELLLRLVASGVLAALTSILLVSLVTRRLSRLAADASTPLTQNKAMVDLPGPFDVQTDDEIGRLAMALNIMRGRIEDLLASLEERDRQRREWVAMVSHDLRTPLTALSACLDRARERLVRRGDSQERPELTEALHVASQDATRLHTLVDDLFELARLDAGEKLLLEPVPPGELVRQTVRGLQPMAEEAGVRLAAEVAPALPTARADGRRLMRALENLVRNAIHFASRMVVVRVASDDGRLKFEVLDDGPGLPIKDGNVVLGKVVIGEGGAQRDRPDSAGLGLMVTRRVATAHGGELGGSNRSSGGANVWFTIPVLPAVDEALPPADE